MIEKHFIWSQRNHSTSLQFIIHQFNYTTLSCYQQVDFLVETVGFVGLQSGESTTSTARSDYSLFYEIYQDQQNYKNGQLAQIPALTGSEVTGSQFKHRYVGTSATDTVYASDLRKCKKASDVASILATAYTKIL